MWSRVVLAGSLCSLSIIATLVGGCVHHDRFEQSRISAGSAEIDITPPIGHRMAGYFDERFATGIHDPLKAKALVFRQGTQQIAMVFCDLVGLSLNVTTNARAQASRQTGIPFHHIVIAATHTHTGPLFDDVRRFYFHKEAVEKYGEDPHETIHYPDFLRERLVEVIAQAQRNVHPIDLAAGIAQQEGLNFNRRYWMKNGKVVFNPGLMNTNIVKPAGPVDHDVGILLLRDSRTQRPFAGLTVFALHSDTVGGTEYSADYEYYLQQTLRAQFGEKFISAFGAGTCGDINHIDVSKKTVLKGFPNAEHIGSTLGKTVLDMADHIPPIDNPALGVWHTNLTIPLQTVRPEELADAKSMISKLGDPNTDFTAKVIAVKRLDLDTKGTSWPMEVQVIRLDAETAVVCLPCEIFVELGLAIKQASPFRKTFVISICNDRPSYVPTKKAFKEGSYEITNARVEAGAGEMLVQAAVNLLQQASR